MRHFVQHPTKNGQLTTSFFAFLSFATLSHSFRTITFVRNSYGDVLAVLERRMTTKLAIFSTLWPDYKLISKPFWLTNTETYSNFPDIFSNCVLKGEMVLHVDYLIILVKEKKYTYCNKIMENFQLMSSAHFSLIVSDPPPSNSASDIFTRVRPHPPPGAALHPHRLFIRFLIHVLN